MVCPVYISGSKLQEFGDHTSVSVTLPSLLTILPLRIERSTGSRVSVSVSG